MYHYKLQLQVVHGYVPFTSFRYIAGCAMYPSDSYF